MRDRFIETTSLRTTCRTFIVNSASANSSLTYVTIYDAPHKLPDSAIEARLISYCHVIFKRRGKIQDRPTTFNGLRRYRVKIYRSIPCFICFGKF